MSAHVFRSIWRRRFGDLAMLLLVVGASQSACVKREVREQQDHSTAEERVAAAASALIDARGGNVAISGEHFTSELVVPAGAVRSPVEISMHQMRDARLGSVAPVIEFFPSGLEFREPAKLKIAFKPGHHPAVLDVPLEVAVLENGEWKRLTQLGSEGSGLDARVPHFSTFGVVTPDGAAPMLIENQKGTSFRAGAIELQTSAEVDLYMMLVEPERLSFAMVSEAASVEIKIGGLRPSTTLFAYDGSFRNKERLEVTAQGTVSFEQELDGHLHGIWLQASESTIFVDGEQPDGGDCGQIGTWTSDRRCVLNQDVYDVVEIASHDTTLDCAGHKIIGPTTSPVINAASGTSGVVIENCSVVASGRAIQVATRAKNALVKNNEILNGTLHSWYNEGGYIHIDSNAIYCGTDFVPSYGVMFIQGAGDVSVLDNTIDCASGIQGGMNAVAGEPPFSFVISNNRLHSPTDSGAGMIVAWAQGVMTIKDNTVRDYADGIYVRSDAGALVNVEGNTIDATSTGLWIGSSIGELVVHRNSVQSDDVGCKLTPVDDADFIQTRVFLNDILADGTLVSFAPVDGASVDPPLFWDWQTSSTTFGLGNYWGRSCIDGAPYFDQARIDSPIPLQDAHPFGVPVASIALSAVPPPPGCDAQQDADGDGYASVATGGDDCDDADPEVHPGADEACDGMDNDCDGVVDPSEDDDGDLHYAIGSCLQPADDCDDFNAGVFPGMPERCDGLDNDCDGVTDPSEDADGDAHYAIGSCLQPADDCDDNNQYVHPARAEFCDGLDNNCNGTTDEGVCDAPVFQPVAKSLDQIYFLQPPLEVPPDGVEIVVEIPPEADARVQVVPGPSGRIGRSLLKIDGEAVNYTDHINPNSRGMTAPVPPGTHTVMYMSSGDGIPPGTTLEVVNRVNECDISEPVVVSPGNPTIGDEFPDQLPCDPRHCDPIPTSTDNPGSEARLVVEKDMSRLGGHLRAELSPSGRTVIASNDLAGTRQAVIAPLDLEDDTALQVEVKGDPNSLMDVRVVDLDQTAPDAVINEPVNGFVTEDETVRVSGVVYDDGARVYVNGVQIPTRRGNSLHFSEDVAVHVGPNGLVVCVEDLCGNMLCSESRVDRRPRLEDADADGILDLDDACPRGETGWTSDGITDHDGDGCRDAGEDLDDDNDGLLDDEDKCPTMAFASQVDADNDGFGVDCDVPGGDDDPNVYPGAPELCDGRDNNGNGTIDEGTGCERCP